MASYPHLTPRCHLCGGPLEVFQGATYCPDCLAWATAVPPEPDLIQLVDEDPDIEAERRAWKEETGEDIVILEEGPADPY